MDQARSVSLQFFLIINYLTAQYFDKIEQKYQKQKSFSSIDEPIHV